MSFSGNDYVNHAYGPDSEPAFDALRRLDREIGRLLEALERRVGRERLVVGSKADVALHDFDGLRLSAVTGEGVPTVVGRLFDLVAAARQSEPEPDAFVILRPVPEGVRVVREGEHQWRITGREAERAVALNDLTNPAALAFVDARLRRLGVGKSLARAGAAAGDVVWIGAFSFDYEPDE